jgi:hypothetical protein
LWSGIKNQGFHKMLTDEQESSRSLDSASCIEACCFLSVYSDANQ